MKVLVPALALLTAMPSSAAEVVVKPAEFRGFLRNPLMGFVTGIWDNNERYADCTLARPYIKWSDIESRESDGIEKIRAFCDKQWAGLPERNIKVVPRVHLHWSEDNEKYWPSDLTTGDYQSPRFKARLVRLIERLGKVWDNDPRVAFIQMGFIGKWGEHHGPWISPELQKLMGEAFTRSFKNKLVMTRNPWDFPAQKFGNHWDSYAHAERGWEALTIARLGDRWKTLPMGGETAYDWGRFREQPGDNPDDTLSDPVHRDNLIAHIRQLHTNHLGWVADYDRKNAAAVAGAMEVQKAFGYRFVLEEARFPAAISPAGALDVSFRVRNEGSTPLYYRWPVQAALLDEAMRKPIWTGAFPVDVRQWQPGDFWFLYEKRYMEAPASHRVSARFAPRIGGKPLAPGKYLLALAICDPAGNRPAARFATTRYFRGGYHPLCRVAVTANPNAVKVEDAALDAAMFDDPGADLTLGYEAPR